MDHVDHAREEQWRIWAAMTPAQRLRLMGRMTAQVIGCREARLRELYPEADEARLRELRIAVTLADIARQHGVTQAWTDCLAHPGAE